MPESQGLPAPSPIHTSTDGFLLLLITSTLTLPRAGKNCMKGLGQCCFGFVKAKESYSGQNLEGEEDTEGEERWVSKRALTN